MSASFINLRERLPVAKRALAFSAPADTSRSRTAGVRENRVTSTRETQQRFRLSTILPPLLDSRTPAVVPNRAGLWGWLWRFFLPAPATPTHCRYPFTRAAILNSCGFFSRFLRSSRVHDANQPPKRGRPGTCKT